MNLERRREKQREYHCNDFLYLFYCICIYIFYLIMLNLNISYVTLRLTIIGFRGKLCDNFMFFLIYIFFFSSILFRQRFTHRQSRIILSHFIYNNFSGCDNFNFICPQEVLAVVFIIVNLYNCANRRIFSR